MLVRHRIFSCLVVLTAVSACTDDEPASGKADSGPNPPGASVEVTRPIELTEDARLPEDDPNLERVEVLENALVFHYRGTPQIELEAGNVVAGAMGDGYLRRLESVGPFEDGKIRAETNPAELVELILEGAFKIRIPRGTGTWVMQQDDDVGVSGSNLETESKLSLVTPELLPGISCGVAGQGDVEIDPSLDVDFGVEVDIDIAVDLFPLRGKLVYAILAIDGEVEAALAAKLEGKFAESCKIDFSDHPAIKTFKFKGPTFTIPAGPIQLVFKTVFEPIAGFEIGATAKTHNALTMSASAAAGLRMGAEFVTPDGADEGAWHGIWEPTTRGSFNLDESDALGDLALKAEGAMGWEWKFFLYDTVGPKIGGEVSVEGSVGVDGAGCMWEGGVKGGLNALLGAELKVPLFDHSLLDWTTKFNLASAQLYSDMGMLDCDAGVDAGMDAGMDAGEDAAVDAGKDAAVDAGEDAAADASLPTGPDCKTILADNPGTPDGVYEIDLGMDGGITPFLTLCDMTTDGGGWTLVGKVLEHDAPDDPQVWLTGSAWSDSSTFGEDGSLTGNDLDIKNPA